jgi:hypothetical protein
MHLIKIIQKGLVLLKYVCAGVNNLYVYKIQRFRSGASNGAPIGGGIDYGFIQFLEPTYWV